MFNKLQNFNILKIKLKSSNVHPVLKFFKIYNFSKEMNAVIYNRFNK